MRMRHLLAGVLSATMILAPLGPRVARAQPTASPADEDKRKGDEAMVALRYEEALDHYRRAYEATKSPALLYNMGRAYEGLGEFPKALDALEEFAEKAPPDLKAKVPKLQELVADVSRRVATIVLGSSEPGAEIRLGEKVLGTTKPGQVVLRVNAGKQKLVVTKEGYFPFERELALEGGRVEHIEARLASRTQNAVLVVRSPISGAAVSVDGRPVGVVPAETFLPPGSHRVGLSRDGYDPAETSVVLAAGERKQVDVPLAERQTLTGKWWFWTAIGVAVVGAGVGTYLAATQERGADTGTIPPGQVKAALSF